MHPNPKRIIPIIIVLAIAGISYWLYSNSRASAQIQALKASGTIEATEFNLASEIAGRVIEVVVDEGDSVTAGQAVIQLDPALLNAQRAQAEAAYSAANNAALAAAANHALLEAGPTPEQLAVAQTLVDKAQLAVDALQETYADLPDLAKDATNGKQLKQQIDQAKATLANAQAQYNLANAGANPKQIEAAQAQADAAQAQAEAAKAALAVLDVQISKLTLQAPVAGKILSRSVEPGSVVLPSATVLTLADLSRLQITVFVPENQYGTIKLGQTAQVTVDSYANQSFTATVIHIADQAEFTPRNVQTVDGRKTTVYAVKLTIENPDDKLKPGMPADVRFNK